MLHWENEYPNRWATDEALDREPDFVILRIGENHYHMKMRSAKQPLWFDTLREAKDYAESCYAQPSGGNPQ